jgi:hypothetical protein
MAIYRDQVSRVTLPMIRAQMKPARFREAKSIRLEKFGFEAEVQLVRVVSPTCFGGERVFFVCPRMGCGALVNVLGCIMWYGWGCTRCTCWRGRNRRRIVTLPPLPWPTATGERSTGKVDAP